MSRALNREEIEAQTGRLGRIEIVILDALSAQGGLTQRDEVVVAAYPELDGDHTGAEGVARRRRAGAEAAVSRALVSLERKGLVVRERNTLTGRTMIRAAGSQPLPMWEQLARAEEDLAAHCVRVAKEWTALARRAHGRAAMLRAERSERSTEAERDSDVDSVTRLEGGTAP